LEEKESWKAPEMLPCSAKAICGAKITKLPTTEIPCTGLLNQIQ